MSAPQKAPPFEGGRRLEKRRCDECEGVGRVAVWPEYGVGSGIVCQQCHGRKFIWLAIVDDGGEQ